MVGLEPTLQRNSILSRTRLPIPPHWLVFGGERMGDIKRMSISFLVDFLLWQKPEEFIGVFQRSAVFELADFFPNLAGKDSKFM